MRGRVLILSTDALFSRMLALEMRMMNLDARVETGKVRDADADVILWDLDSVRLAGDPPFGQIIGFTGQFELSRVDPERHCSLILHRPFEMRLLREELMACLESAEERSVARQPRKMTLTMEGDALLCNDTRIPLSHKEAQVMRVLLEHSPAPVSREALRAVIGESASNKADVYVCYLRRKTEALFDKPLIRTVRGKGYRLEIT
ncbi:MAG: winged helix-turn-helix domain-containing protein [Clostridia bacterium]|nr:winged helix-turn-helix domain-containing protein [Clostridia bacterium]